MYSGYPQFAFSLSKNFSVHCLTECKVDMPRHHAVAID